MYDLVIIGGGPAGISAAIYASRKKIKFILITESFGGQSSVASEIQNWIGTKSISGFELAKKMEEHLRAQEDVEIEEGSLVDKVEKIEGLALGWKVHLQNGKDIETKTILVASGGRRRRLDVAGEKEFEGKGVVYCSTCDAPLFSKKDVAIVGAGNAALGAVKDLLSYANKIYLLIRSDKIKGDSILFEDIKKDKRVEILMMSEVSEIFGEEFVEGLKYTDKGENQTKELKISGVFVEIGSVPNSEFLGDLVDKNKYNEIIVDFGTQKTSCAGIWAAGDVTTLPYRQNNISAGDGIKALLDINFSLKNKTPSRP
ncbi:FAD-dependent oxidoreductase [Patescibacteria group bacterium]|nr:FAD-dependent oxidoreductase [Patescibacteria group bacterium]